MKVYTDKVVCPDCGGETERDYSGTVYSSTGKKPSGCTGNCSTCGGCHWIIPRRKVAVFSFIYARAWRKQGAKSPIRKKNEKNWKNCKIFWKNAWLYFFQVLLCIGSTQEKVLFLWAIRPLSDKTKIDNCIAKGKIFLYWRNRERRVRRQRKIFILSEKKTNKVNNESILRRNNFGRKLRSLKNCEETEISRVKVKELK